MVKCLIYGSFHALYCVIRDIIERKQFGKVLDEK